MAEGPKITTEVSKQAGADSCLIIFDMDGVLIPESEHVFAECCKEVFGIEIEEYVVETLIRGSDFTNSKTEELKDHLNNIYPLRLFQYIANDPSGLIACNTRVLQYLKKIPGIEMHLLSQTRGDIGEALIHNLSWCNYFKNTSFGVKKLSNGSVYSDYLKRIDVKKYKQVVIVEDSISNVANIAKLLEHQVNIKIFFIINPIYYKYEKWYEEMQKILNKYQAIKIIFKLYELISYLGPFTSPPSEFLPSVFTSAHTPLDDLFRSFELYKQLYQIPCYVHYDRIEEPSFSWVKKRDYYIIFALLAKDVSGNYSRVLMKMDFSSGHVKWLLPGGGVRPEYGDDYIDTLFKKFNDIFLKKKNINFTNLYPLCTMVNIFVGPNGDTHLHRGIGWIGYTSASAELLEELSQEVGHFENEFVEVADIDPHNITQYPNRMVATEMKKVPHTFTFEEEGNLKKTGRFIHNFFVKPFFAIFKEHKKFIKTKAFEVNPISFLDVSCGDDKDIVEIIHYSGTRIAVLNDVSTASIMRMKKFVEGNRAKYPTITFMFSMQDVTNLNNMRESVFDFVLCKNTLHHFSSWDVKEKCLGQLKKVARKRILIMDVEYPKTEASKTAWMWRWLIRLRHWWYMEGLGEAGPRKVDSAFLSFNDFQNLIRQGFPDANFNVYFERIKTPRAAYIIAVIDRRT